jgi:hypothetical protein
MPENFEQELRDGASQFASGVVPGSVSQVRARGDQRRRRKAAATMALAIAIVAGGGGAAYALGQPGHPGGSPNTPVATNSPNPRPAPKHTVAPHSSPPATSGQNAGAPGTTNPPPGATTLRLGDITLQAPDTWSVIYDAEDGMYVVSTGSCTNVDSVAGMGGSSCPTFDVILNVGPEHGPSPTLNTYDPSGPYVIGTGVSGCPNEPYGGEHPWFRNGGTSIYSGFAPVTTTLTADYNVWQIDCQEYQSSTPPVTFQQADWYLPVSKILIVDEYSIPGLSQVLASGTWQLSSSGATPSPGTTASSSPSPSSGATSPPATTPPP